jgi:hypothetical protein
MVNHTHRDATPSRHVGEARLELYDGTSGPPCSDRWGTTLKFQQLRQVRDDVAAYLSGGELASELAALLRRWSRPSRPAILVAVDWDPPFAEVYAEAELLATFPTAPLIHARAVEDVGPGTVLVYVIDQRGETSYAIPDPRASSPAPRMPDAETGCGMGPHGPR